FDLVVFDPIMNFLPASLSDPKALRWALGELRTLASLMPATAVLLIHQSTTIRNRPRANGPLLAFPDILIDLQFPSSPLSLPRLPRSALPRRRIPQGVGRLPGTLQQVAADLNPEGTDYVVHNYGPSSPASDSYLLTSGPSGKNVVELGSPSPDLCTISPTIE